MQPIETGVGYAFTLRVWLFTGSWAMQPIETIFVSELAGHDCLQGVGQCSPLKHDTIAVS